MAAHSKVSCTSGSFHQCSPFLTYSSFSRGEEDELKRGAFLLLPPRPHSLDFAGLVGLVLFTFCPRSMATVLTARSPQIHNPSSLCKQLFHLINSELCDLILVSKSKCDTVPRHHGVSTGRVLVTLLRTAVRLATLPFSLLVAFLRTSFTLGTSV